MGIAFAMLARRHSSWFYLVPAAVMLFQPDLVVALSMLLSYLLIYQFSSKSLIGSNLLFYVITNGACFLAFYEKTPAGLATCYVSALPFLAKAYVVSFIWVKLGEMLMEKMKERNYATQVGI